jgi:catechol 2,3-dioxygenase-like lactoylglutathione lyase family enzyme
MDMRLELVGVPVTDVDRAKEFYLRVGFTLDHEHVLSREECTADRWPGRHRACKASIPTAAASTRRRSRDRSVSGVQSIV